MICPVGKAVAGVTWAPGQDCGTDVQRLSGGTLVDGIAAHLRAVHNVPRETSQVVAERWVESEQHDH